MKYQKGEFTTVPSKSIRRGLPPKLQVIYMWLCEYSDDNYESFPSRTRLAKDCGISLRALDDGLSKLEQLKLIEKQQRIVNGEFTSNLYTVNIIALPSAKSALPSAKKDTTPSAKSAHRTQPNTNSTHLTTTTDVVESVDLVSKAYYEAIKSLALPVTNHTVIRAKIKELKDLYSEEQCIWYLNFMKNDYASWQTKYKPQVSQALDIYSKSNAIIKRLVEDNKKAEVF